MKKNRIASLAMAFLGVMALASCNNTEDDMPALIPTEDTTVSSSSNSLYVNQVNLKQSFIKGIDMSSLISLENAGVKFYDYDGKEQDALKTVAQSGVNYIRVRVWNDPYDANKNGYGGGNNDLDTCIKIGKRATQYGMKLLVDFHYSDFWADPGRQTAPKAWASMTLGKKQDAIYSYTKTSLEKIKFEGIDVGMVQVGNETNAKFCGETAWGNIGSLMASASEAIRDVDKNILIAVHFANPEKAGNYSKYAYQLAVCQVDYDVFGTSYYPYWHGTLDNLKNVLNEVANEYHKKTMVLETSYAFTNEDNDFGGNTAPKSTDVTNYPITVQGQTNCITDIIKAVSEIPSGIGVCYWEGAWIPAGGANYSENYAKWTEYGCGWASKYAKDYDKEVSDSGGTVVDNQAFFDKNGHPLESLKLWNLVNKGNKIEIKEDAIEKTSVQIDLAGDIVLPSEINVVMNDNSKRSTTVTWNLTEGMKNTMKSSGVARYEIEGTTAAGAKAYCIVDMVEYNFLTDYSFEDTPSKKVNAPWKLVTTSKMDECYVEKYSQNAVTGENSFHFWSAASNSVDFAIEQDVTGLKAGTYKVAATVQGGDVGEHTVYVYAKINGVEVARGELYFDGWNVWIKNYSDNFTVKAGDTVTVGVYVKCAGSGAGAWGNIDDVLLNSVL